MNGVTLGLANKAIQPITDKEFLLFQALIQKESGIHLSHAKKPLLASRLTRRLRELGLNSFGAYYNRIAYGDAQEMIHMFDCICTNETHFFREPRQFEFLQQTIFADWLNAGARRLRIWSAGCSTGEEPYSLAMCLLAYFPPESGWQIEILATDLSTRALAKAQEAIWPVEKAKNIPHPYLKRFMLKGKRSQEGKMKAGPEIRSIIKFQRLNLNDDVYSVNGRFDMIFCRNVLIYFNTPSKLRVVDRLVDRLVPSGYLFLGHAESLSNLSNKFRSLIPTVYLKSGQKDPREVLQNGTRTFLQSTMT